MTRGFAKIGVIALIVMLGGCSGYSTFRRAEIAEQLGNWDEAVLHYMELSRKDPGNISYRANTLRAKIQASQMHFQKGKDFHEAGARQRAMLEYRQAVELDPTNQYAFVQLEKVVEELKAAAGDERVLTVAQMKEEARKKSQPPILSPRSDEPISLNFPEPESVQDIYRALGKAFGINVLFDPNLKEQEIAIELIDVDAEKALEILMRASGHFYKVLDEQTIMIAADTPQNRRAYEDLMIQTFFLSNAEVKDVVTMLRSIIDAKKVSTNEQLNAIILRDTADKVRVAERIIRANDKAKAEVVVDVELLQLNSLDSKDLGLQLSNYSVGVGLDLGGGGEGATPLRISDLSHLTQNNWSVTVPSFVYNFAKANTESQVLAKPQMRITEGEKGSLHIGDRVPIPTTSFNTSNTVGGNVVPITSFQYTDVGIKIDIEPRVHHNLEITLKVKVEISNISGTAAGGDQPIIGTRTIETTIRLKDGETNFLAGLIRTDETSTKEGVAGLSEIPILGRLFSHTDDSTTRTDVLLTLTPHIIRKSDITEEDLLPIWVGTETNFSFRGGSPRLESERRGPFDSEREESQKRIQDGVRDRFRQLPEGSQAPTPEKTEENKAPEGVELVPNLNPEKVSFQTWRELEVVPAISHNEAPRFRFAESGAAVALRLKSPAVVRGDRPFEVRVEAESTSPVAHLPFEIHYDPYVLEWVGREKGDFLGEATKVEALVVETEPGVLQVGVSHLGSTDGKTGIGDALVLLFRSRETEMFTRLDVVQPRALGPDLKSLSIEGEGTQIRLKTSTTLPPDPYEI